MKIGFIGLGRMGKAMVMHLLEGGVDVAVFNRTVAKIDELVDESENLKAKISKLQIKAKSYGNLTPSYDIEELVSKLEAPRVVILMVPQGGPVVEMIEKLTGTEIVKDPGVARGNHPKGVKLEEGDTIIDGGNCWYKDSQRHYSELKEEGINYIDMGTSGGLEGARNGVCLMIGGDEEVYKKFEQLFKLMACKEGYGYFGPSGAGHFVKMVHNGVEYGMLQALGEGFEILEKGFPIATPFTRGPLAKPDLMGRREGLDLRKVAYNWSHGSVVRGWLTELLERALKKDQGLAGIEGKVGGGTTGRWTIDTARELNVATPVIYESLRARETSQVKPTFAGKVVAAVRREFGGHEVKIKNQK